MENRSPKLSPRFFESPIGMRRCGRNRLETALLTAGIEPQTTCSACLTEVHETHKPLTDAAITWGWIALGATILSAVGYALQTLFDHVSVPADLARLVFFGLFEWDGVLALFAGFIAVWTGRSRNDWTFRLGIIAIAYVVLVQTTQSLWD